jgi:Carboxypeptidase regulatory-like domain
MNPSNSSWHRWATERGLQGKRSRRHYLNPSTRVITLALLMILGFAAPCLAAAQQISGIITDTLGRPLAGAKLELRNENGTPVAAASSDQSGRFNLVYSRPGVFSLVALKAGFKSATKIVSFPGSAGQTIAMTLDARTALRSRSMPT